MIKKSNYTIPNLNAINELILYCPEISLQYKGQGVKDEKGHECMFYGGI